MKLKGRHLLVLVGACGLIASGVGLVTNVAGLFFTPVGDELAASRGAVSMTLTICNICFGLGGMLAPLLMRAKSPRPLLVGATTALAASTAGLAFCHSMPMMYALSVIRGFSAGIGGMVFATTVVGNWFHAAVGLVTSITFGFSGIAGALFAPVVSAAIASAGWRAGYLLVALLTVLLNLPAILGVPAVDPRDCGMLAYGDEEGVVPAEAERETESDAAPLSAAPLSLALLALVLAYAVIGSGLTGFPQHFPGLAESRNLGIGALMLSVCMIANTGGKILFGALVDTFGAKVSILGYCALVLAAVILMLFVPTVPAMVVSAALYGLCYAIATVGISMTVRTVFGDGNYARVYPTMSFGGNIANAAFSSIIGFMYDFSGGYTLVLVVMGAMAVTTAALIVAAYGGRKVAEP